MKFQALASLVGLSVLAGCASSADAPASAESEIVQRDLIDLGQSGDETSLSSRLFNLLDTFRDEPSLQVEYGMERDAFSMNGESEAQGRARSLACHARAPESGTDVRSEVRCSLEGWDDGNLWSVYGPVDAPQLGPKLFTLLKLGIDKGGLGVKATVDSTNGELLYLRDARGSVLYCIRHGHTDGSVQTRCAYERGASAPEPSTNAPSSDVTSAENAPERAAVHLPGDAYYCGTIEERSFTMGAPTRFILLTTSVDVQGTPTSVTVALTTNNAPAAAAALQEVETPLAPGMEACVHAVSASGQWAFGEIMTIDSFYLKPGAELAPAP